MKKLAPLFSFAGFIIQYMLPILLFGDIIPYTREGVGKCLTGMGYVAVILACYFITKKLKEWLLQQPKSLLRALILSVFPIAWWLVVFFILEWVGTFVLTFAQYWDKVIFFIIIGRLFYCVSEAIQDVNKETDVKKESADG